jgi:uncharacterized protein YbcI
MCEAFGDRTSPFMVDGQAAVDQRAARGRVLASISNSMVRLYSECYGRGPTRAKTFWHEDVVCVILEDVYTGQERTLIDAGHGEHVRTTRRLLQETMRERLVSSIEELTGRSVRGLLSQSEVEPDACVEIFLLEPQA